MCGIYGVFSFSDGGELDPDCIEPMSRVTAHRGPDDAGAYRGSRALLGMRRLSIIDLAGGHQPIPNEDETLQVVCNGEIYNFRELRRDLERAGHRFRSGSDAEVIVHLYEEHGDAFVEHLRGMFGFALWDGRRERLIVGRDRLGIKPLYYHDDGARLVFASEMKAILTLPDVPVEIDPLALEQYFLLGYVPAPLTILKGVRKLPVASLLICERTGFTTRRYWDPPVEIDRSISEEDWIHRLRETLEEAVVSQMVSDVPIGAFLSGGIDSSAVVGLMSRHTDEPVRTYSIGFDSDAAGSYYSELPFAKQVAKLFKTQHKEIIVRPDVTSLLPKLLWHMDEPIADSAFVTTYLVAEFARRDVKVILSGVGGDEFFGGYRRYLGERFFQYYGLLPGWFRRGVMKPIGRRLPSDRHSPLMNLSRYARGFILAGDLSFEDRYRSYVGVFGRDALADLLVSRPEGGSFDALDDAFRASGGGDVLTQLTRVDMLTQLPDDLLMLTDKMTMATSLECRVPLLDERVVELSLRMPERMKIRGRQLKYVLKKGLADLLPNEILHRTKRGFGAPMGAWLKSDLQRLMQSVLSPAAIESRGLLRPEAVAETMRLHQASKEDHTDHLLAMLNLELWCRLTLDGQPPEELAAQLQEQVVMN